MGVWFLCSFLFDLSGGIRSFLCKRKREPYPPAGILRKTAAFMPFENFLHNIQSQPASSGLPVSGRVCAIKSVKQFGQAVFRDVDAASRETFHRVMEMVEHNLNQILKGSE